MKIIKMIICFVMAVFLLLSCSSTKSDGETDEVYIPTLRELYRYSPQVYRGVCLENTPIAGTYDAILKIEVLTVFKGTLLPGETIKEQLEIDYTQYSQLRDGGEYLFFVNPTCLWTDYIIPLTGKKHSEIVAIVLSMLNTKALESEINWHFVNSYTGSRLSIEQMFVLSENVYFGEVISSFPCGEAVPDVELYNEWGAPLYFYKVKVRVIDVVKGDFVPGEIVEDIFIDAYNDFEELEKENISSFGGYPGIYFSMKGLLSDEDYNSFIKLKNYSDYIKQSKEKKSAMLEQQE